LNWALAYGGGSVREAAENSGVGKKLALEILTRRRADVVARIPESESPASSFYAFLKQTRRKYFFSYMDLLKDAIESGDTTDFLGNETFQSYSHAKNGFTMKDVLSIPTLAERALVTLAGEMAAKGEVRADAALEAAAIICDILGQAETIRAESFTQTREEVVRFYHTFQEEIDRFPSNLAATLDFSTLMLSAVKKCKELTGAERCAFYSRDLLTNDLHLEASDYDFAELEVRLDESIIKQLVHQRKTVIVEGYPRSMPIITSTMRKLNTKLIVLVPLKVRNRNVGVMILDNVDRPQVFTPETVNLAERFASKVAAAMENARLHGSEQQKLKETMALLEVSRLMTSTLDIEVLLSRLVQITADVCEVGKCTVYIYLEEKRRFYPTATFGMFPESEWETQMSEGIMPEDLVSEEAEALLRHEAVVCDASLSPFIPEDRLADTGVKSVLLVPISSHDHLLGVMGLFYNKDRDDLDSQNFHLVRAIAGQAAVAMENASLYEDLEMSYFSTVKALARAIEVKDPYTYGHSERVTEYAMVIARKLNLEEWELRNIKYASALHDIGKLGISMHILNKPGKLSEEEFIHVKTHPQMGDSIIEPVSFLREPREIILHHHERYDGKGYPAGLKGSEIPLGARILAVADSFEAMMSDRPYRKALSLAEALKEMKVNSGTQFDPEIVEAFIDALGESDKTRVGDVVKKVETEIEAPGQS
jgi:HD-GYP domain-containing protein (c-di-GMP phosphodiesterase class II)